MQNRFKFRMFDKNISKMWNFDNDCMLETVFECLKQQLAFNSGLEIFKPISYDHISDGRIFMQCTGLKDKNGRLIYEGDIVKNWENREYEIIWCYEAACFLVQNIRTKCKQGIYSLISLDNGLEVIGNVYENPELLEEKNTNYEKLCEAIGIEPEWCDYIVKNGKV